MTIPTWMAHIHSQLDMLQTKPVIFPQSLPFPGVPHLRECPHVNPSTPVRSPAALLSRILSPVGPISQHVLICSSSASLESVGLSHSHHHCLHPSHVMSCPEFHWFLTCLLAFTLAPAIHSPVVILLKRKSDHVTLLGSTPRPLANM